jgi:hypothetical protein
MAVQVVPVELSAWYTLIPVVCVYLVGKIHLNEDANVVRAI